MNSSALSIRPAITPDLGVLTSIALAAWPEDPQWNYRYPYAAEYPEDHAKFTRRRYQEWLEAADSPECTIMVAETARTETDTMDDKVIVGFSIWRIPPRDGMGTQGNKMRPPRSKSPRRDAELDHMNAYALATDFAHEQYLEPLLGKQRMSLAQLLTHPDYRRRGAATMLLQWGLEQADREAWPITLFAGPAGVSIYQRAGFEIIVNITVQVAGEEVRLEMPAMVRSPRMSVKDGIHHENRLLAIYQPQKAKTSTSTIETPAWPVCTARSEVTAESF